MMTIKAALSLVVIAALAVSIVPGRATAQDGKQDFEPGFGGPRGDIGDGRWGERGRRRPNSPGMRRPGSGRRGHGRGTMRPGGADGLGGLRMALRNLDLSAAQREEVGEVFETERSQVEANHEQMRALGTELHEQIESDPYDEEAVRAKAAAVAALRVEMAVLRAQQLGRIRDLLTPEQLDKLQQMKDRHKSFREQRHERFGQRGEPNPGS